MGASRVRRFHHDYAAGTVALACCTATSAQLVYEPFDYGSASAGTNLAHTSSPPADPFTGYVNPMVGLPWVDTNTAATGTPTEVITSSGSIPTPVTAAPSLGNSAVGTVISTAGRS